MDKLGYIYLTYICFIVLLKKKLKIYSCINSYISERLHGTVSFNPKLLIWNTILYLFFFYCYLFDIICISILAFGNKFSILLNPLPNLLNNTWCVTGVKAKICKSKHKTCKIILSGVMKNNFIALVQGTLPQIHSMELCQGNRYELI